GGNTVGIIYNEAILANEAHYSLADLDAVRESYIYFCHQSIGSNILNGLDSLGDDESKYEVTRNYVMGSGFSLFRGNPAVGESQPGSNGNPESKITGFYEKMTTGTPVMGNNVQIAFHKFCYVDITSSTDVEAVFNSYKSNMEDLEDSYLDTIFVYTTVPLGLGHDNDVARNAYNTLVRDYCSDNGKPLFDIASVEATQEDGDRCTFESGGKTLDRLCQEYSSGDPHLDSTGGRRIAKVMMLMFADLLR
ncbi:MAG: hypothetical protein GY869_03095, partial [Planctomycetes bacterium]|nr:hypothetical protein [Planctomycetota bacterium]